MLKKEIVYKSFIEIIGWYGVIAILGAYFLITYLFLTPQDMIYLTLNITGALAIITHSLFKRDYQPAVLNMIWAVIALSVLVKSIF